MMTVNNQRGRPSGKSQVISHLGQDETPEATTIKIKIKKEEEETIRDIQEAAVHWRFV